jgi:hypothetical protein
MIILLKEACYRDLANFYFFIDPLEQTFVLIKVSNCPSGGHQIQFDLHSVHNLSKLRKEKTTNK